MSVALTAPAKTPTHQILGRDRYDALILQPGSQSERRAERLIEEAIKAGLLRPEAISSSRGGRDWAALNHDVYAVAAQARVIVVQERQSVRTKYGVSSRKRYVLVYREGGKVRGRELPAGSVRGIITRDQDPAAVIRRHLELLPEALAEAVHRTDRVWTRGGEPE